MQKNKTEDLVKKAKRKDPDAFSQLMQLYNLNSALNYNEEGTGTFILNALKIAL